MTPAAASPHDGDAPEVLVVGELGPGTVGSFVLHALEQEGTPHASFDLAPALEQVRRNLATRALYRLTGTRARPLRRARRALLRTARRLAPEEIIIIKGDTLDPGTIAALGDTTGATVKAWTTDDPWNRAASLRGHPAALARCDVVATPRRSNVADLVSLDGPEVHVLPFAYHPPLHRPPISPVDETEPERPDLVFIGGADPTRRRFIREVLDLRPDLALQLYGGYWDRDARLRPYARGFVRGPDYARTLHGARACLGLVRHANRDDHAMRTYEIPACGGLLLAERTEHHEMLFQDGRDALLFDDAEELLEHLDRLHEDPKGRDRIAEAGHHVITRGGHRYADRVADLRSMGGTGGKA